MSFFNALYTLGECRTTQPIQNNSHIEVDFDSQNTCAQLTRWAKWIVTFPINIAHGTYNTAYMLATQDIHKVISSQIYEGNSINRLQFLWGKSGHVFTSPKAIAAITAYHRHDVEGPFERDNEDLFTPVLKDLYPEESVDQEDFLFTCSHSYVKTFRNPLLEYIGPKALSHLRSKIDQVSEEVLGSITEHETISARNLAEKYTVAILARLFLNHPGTLEDFQNIGRAASRVVEYQFIKKWGKPNEEQFLHYTQDLQTLRNAIECSSGEFLDFLQSADLSPIQIKGELLLAYIAGSETSSSVLEYVLWRLGQDPNLQNAIRNTPESVGKFITDCTSEYTPVTFFSRFARQDLVISVQNPDGSSWKYPIAKGEALIIAPNLAKSSIFGGGVHSCPGQWLARAELSSMVSKLVTHYDIDSSPVKKGLSTVPGVGFLKVEPVDLALRKRE